MSIEFSVLVSWVAGCISVVALLICVAKRGKAGPVGPEGPQGPPGRLDGMISVVDYAGAVGDGITDDTAKVQDTIDAASGSRKSVYFPPGRYSITSTLTVPNSVALVGAGPPRSAWHATTGSSALVWNGAADGTCVLVGGTASSVLTTSGYKSVESVRVESLAIFPGKGGGGIGLLADGSNTLDADRGVVRDLILRDVHIKGFTIHQCELRGNVYHTRTHSAAFRNDTASTGAAFKTTDTTTNLTPTLPGQIFHYDSLFWSSGQDVFAAEVAKTVFFGGHVQGFAGVKANDQVAIYGTHLEGQQDASPTAGTVGLYFLDGVSFVVDVPMLYNWDKGIVIGDTAENTNFAIGYDIRVGTAVTLNTLVFLAPTSADNKRRGRIRVGYRNNVGKLKFGDAGAAANCTLTVG